MKLLRGRSIRQKLNFILLVTAFLALLLAGIALAVFDLRNQARHVETDLVTQADIIGLASSSALAFDDPKAATENLSVLRAKGSVATAALYNADGGLFAWYVPIERAGLQPPAREQAAGVHFGREWVQVWRPVRTRGDVIGTVHLQARHDLLSRALDYLGVLAIVLSSSLAAALLLSNRLQRSLTEPIMAVSEVAQNILQGTHFDLRAEKKSDDEVGALVDVFNAMLDELGRRAKTLEQANQALRTSEARYQLAVRGSSAGLWDWDMEAGTMFYSPRFKALLGYSNEEFPDLPHSIRKVLHPEDRDTVREALRAHLAHDRPYQLEVRLRLKSGEWRWFFVAGMAQKGENGRPFRMAGSVIDVTERKEAERTLQDANRAKDEFLATLAHELRNPLAPIRTGLEILKKDQANGPASHRARETMERQLLHMIRLIDDLLDISRITRGKIRLESGRVRLRAVIDSAVEINRPVIESAHHQLALEVPQAEIELVADATRLAQALGNLLNNAAKYTPAGGHIAMQAWQEDAEAVIEVRDNGVGIPADMLEKVFHLFTQVGNTIERSQGGLGIGLSLVRRLVELHGGSVSARSAGPNQGSTFTLRVPCLPQGTAAPGPGKQPDTPRRPDALKLLVVDDNVDAAETLATVLAIGGHHTRTVNAGPAVLDAAGEFEPDIVLLDIGMPVMNGYEVARQLRADPRFARTVLIAVTGWGTQADRVKAQDAGFDHHLTKPVDLAALESLLRLAPA